MKHLPALNFTSRHAPAFSDVFPPASARVHEVCGAGAASFALATAAARQHTSSTVIWLYLRHRPHCLNAQGVARYLQPSELIFASAANNIDLLWMTEEALRDGAAPTVITQGAGTLDLTEGRRLQLAAKQGKGVGVMLLSDATAGSNAAQSRWACAPVPNPAGHTTTPMRSTDSTLQHWQLIKNKSGTLANWTIDWHEQTGAISVV